MDQAYGEPRVGPGFRFRKGSEDGYLQVRDHVGLASQRLTCVCSDKGPPPPGVTVAARKQAADPNAEPHYAERVRYVIARGLPGSRLVERAFDPLEFLNNRCVFLAMLHARLIRGYKPIAIRRGLLYHARSHAAARANLQPGRRGYPTVV